MGAAQSATPMWTTRDVAVAAACTAATLGLGIWIGGKMALEVIPPPPANNNGINRSIHPSNSTPAVVGVPAAAAGVEPADATAIAPHALADWSCEEVCHWMTANRAAPAVVTCFRQQNVNGTDVLDVLEEGYGLSVADKLVYLGVAAGLAREASVLLLRLQAESGQ